MQHSKRDNTWSKWGIFLGVAVALGALVVVGWTFMQNRFQPGSSLDADVTIGIDDMPQSLDIRSDSSAAAERLLVDNVYETLVTVDQDNKLQPGLATSWKTSDDGLTVTLTLQSGVTFSNGHTLDASDAVWSLQQNVTNKVADVDELGDLASVAIRTPPRWSLRLPSPIRRCCERCPADSALSTIPSRPVPIINARP